MSATLDGRRDVGARLARRYAVTLAASVVLHLLLGILVVLFGLEPPALAEDDEILVPLELESPPPPDVPALQPDDASPEVPEEPEAPRERDVPEDASLLGFRSEGTIKARPDRPVGPEAEIHGSTPAGGGETGAPPEVVPPDASDEPETVEEPPPPERDEPRESAADARTNQPREAVPERVFPGAPLDDPVRDPASPRTGEPEPLLPPREEALDLPRPAPRPAPARPPGPGDSALDFDVGVRGGMFGNLDFDSPDYNWSDYSTKVYFAVYRAWLRELHARARRFEREQKLDGLARLDGQVSIHFVIRRDGSVSNLEIVAPSVIGNLDEASSAALLRAVLPPLPTDFPRTSEGVTFRFILSVDNALQMERILNYRRARGEF